MRRIFLSAAILIFAFTGWGLGQTPSPSASPAPDQFKTVLDSIAGHPDEWIGEVQLKIPVSFPIKHGEKVDGYIDAKTGVLVKVVEIAGRYLVVQLGAASAFVPAADTDLTARWAQKRKTMPKPEPSVAAVSPIPTPTPTPAPSGTPVAKEQPKRTGGVWVNGYWRKSGTYVNGYWRGK